MYLSNLYRKQDDSQQHVLIIGNGNVFDINSCILDLYCCLGIGTRNCQIGSMNCAIEDRVLVMS